MPAKYHFEAAIFDLDGVITRTALVHSHAWKKMFDDYLRQREIQHGEPFREFTQKGSIRKSMASFFLPPESFAIKYPKG